MTSNPLADPLDYDVTALRRALWDCFVAMGGDTDGNTGPESIVYGLRNMTVGLAQELHRDYFELINELDDLEKRVCHDCS